MDYIVEILLCLMIILLVTYFVSGPSRHDLPPGPRPLPLLGNALLLARSNSMYREMLRLRDEYGDIFTLFLGPYPSVVINGYDLIHETLVKNSDSTIARPKELFRIAQGDNRRGIIFQDGHPWRTLRRFTLSTLRDLGFGKKTVEEKILEESAAVNREVEKRVGKEWNDTKITLNMATSNVICHLIFGTRFEYEDERFKSVLRKMVQTFTDKRAFDVTQFIPLYRYLSEKLKILPRRGVTELIESIRDLVTDQVREHKKTFDGDNIRDYVDMYLKVSSEGNEDIQEEDMFGGIIDLFLAGSETSATTIAWALLYMMEYPDIQKRCQQEIDEVVGRNRQVRVADKKNLRYIEATICEVQRIASTVTIAPFHQASEDLQIGGHKIPKGTAILPNLYSALRDPRYWKHPDTFWPGHFLDENGEVKTPPAFIPFSEGPRICLGENLARMEIFLFFTNIIQQFTFSKVSQQDHWLDQELALNLIRSPPQYKIQVSVRE